jgi:hypothetical protein
MYYTSLRFRVPDILTTGVPTNSSNLRFLQVASILSVSTPFMFSIKGSRLSGSEGTKKASSFSF